MLYSARRMLRILEEVYGGGPFLVFFWFFLKLFRSTFVPSTLTLMWCFLYLVPHLLPLRGCPEPQLLLSMDCGLTLTLKKCFSVIGEFLLFQAPFLSQPGPSRATDPHCSLGQLCGALGR